MKSTKAQLQWLAPLLVLLITGSLLGLTMNLSKIAASLGINALAYITWSVLLASIFMSMLAAYKGSLPRLTRSTTPYYIASAVLSLALPNLIFFSAVSRVGVSFVSLALTLPPLLTYLLALTLKMERFCLWRATGIAFALAGTVYLSLLKLTAPNASIFWISATLLAPVLLATGNVFRTLYWPKNAKSESLAAGMMIASTLLLLAIALLPIGEFNLSVPTANPSTLLLIFAQGVTFTLLYTLYFVLQRLGGPVYVSIMGGVSAVLGIPFAVFLLNENPPQGLPLGATLIAAGVSLVTYGGLLASKRRA